MTKDERRETRDELGTPVGEAAEQAAYLARTPQSRAWYERAVGALPGGDTRTGTFFLPYPTFMDRGVGCRVYDLDGHEYLDLINNFTSLVHGHAHPAVTAAIAAQAARGTALGAPCELQVRLAEALKSRFLSIEALRFCNSGTEANLNAIRAARAFTGRAKIMKMEGGYHGSYDPVRVSVNPGPAAPDWPAGRPDDPGLSPGMTGEVLVAPFNDLATSAGLIDRYRHELAAVIVEPVMGVAGVIPADPAFLRGLRKATASSSPEVLLIADEVVTFRLSTGGAQALYDLQPDLTTFGKIIGGGLPVGAFGGRADVMALFDPRGRSPITQSGTFNGAAVVMAAGLATIELLTDAEIARINRLGDRLRAGFTRVLREAGVPAETTGIGSLSQVHFVDAPVRDYRSAARGRVQASRLLHLALMNRGLFSAARGLFAISTPMTDAEIDWAVSTFRDAMRPLAAAYHDRSGCWL